MDSLFEMEKKEEENIQCSKVPEKDGHTKGDRFVPDFNIRHFFCDSFFLSFFYTSPHALCLFSSPLCENYFGKVLLKIVWKQVCVTKRWSFLNFSFFAFGSFLKNPKDFTEDKE